MAEDFYVSEGDTVLMRDKRRMLVTNIAFEGDPEGEYQTIDKSEYEQGREVITSSIPAETIFVGTDSYGSTVVSDLSEVVSVLN